MNRFRPVESLVPNDWGPDQRPDRLPVGRTLPKKPYRHADPNFVPANIQRVDSCARAIKHPRDRVHAGPLDRMSHGSVPHLGRRSSISAVH